MQNQICLKSIYLLFPILVILFPVFPQYSKTPFGTLGDWVLFLTMVGSMFLFFLLKVYDISTRIIHFLVAVLFVLLILISLSYEFINGDFIFNDLFELARPFLFLLIFLFYKNSRLRIIDLEKETIRAMMIVFCFLSIYTIVEFLCPDTLREISLFLWKEERLEKRFVGSFWTPYYFAYALMIPLFYSWMILLKKTTLINFITFLLFLSAFLLIQSRSMYIAVIIGFVMTFFLPYFRIAGIRGFFKMSTIYFCFISVIIYIFNVYYFEIYDILYYSLDGIPAMLEGRNGSANGRMEQIRWAVENNQIVIIGQGIGKKNHNLLESFYSMYYYRYGLLGMLTFLVFTVITGIKSYAIAVMEYATPKISCFYLALFVFYCTAPIWLLSGTHHDTPKNSLLFYGLMGLVFCKYTSLKLGSDSSKVLTYSQSTSLACN
jgi:hypothetical protein